MVVAVLRPLGGRRHRGERAGEEAESEAEGSVGRRLLLRSGNADPEGGPVGELGVGGSEHLPPRRPPEERAEGAEGRRRTYSTKTTAVTDAEFEKTFTTPGTYKFICTIHPTQMHMTIVVKK